MLFINGWRALAVTVVVCFLHINLLASEILVRSQQEYQQAVEKASAGDTIVLANGVWRDFEILFEGHGTEVKPITLRAETKGQVIISGQSNLRIAGDYLVVSGLVFKNGFTPTSTVISFRRTKGVPANHSRVTETVIDHFSNPERQETDFWVLIFGKHNRFDHNHLVGKGNAGVTLAIRLDGEENQENHHRIDHNYFGPRPALGSNGGETLRIGTSHYSLTDSFSVVENNVFDRCNGEVEIVSSKSGGNVFRRNLFLESRGTLTLRHGNNSVIEENVFLGNGVPNTGGIRVINKGHLIRNNYLKGLTGYRFGGALVVMNGVPDSPINRYHQVEDVVIENNTIIDSEHIELAAGSDEERSATPIATTVSSNIIFNHDKRNIIRVYDDLSGIDFSSNAFNGVLNLPLESGVINDQFEMLEAENGLLYPSHHKLGELGVSPELSEMSVLASGVSWYSKPSNSGRFGDANYSEIETISPQEDALTDAVGRAKSNSLLILTPGVYTARKTILVDKPVSIQARDGPGSVKVFFERTTLFEISNGGSLSIDGIEISGTAAPDVAGNSVIRTSRYSMNQNYHLLITNSRVHSLNTNHSFNVVRVSKNTFADRIEIAGSEFENITGDVLALDLEGDALGRYNGEFVGIRESAFRHIGGAVVKLLRGGTDESTFGPRLEMQGNLLEDIGHNKRNRSQSSIYLHGVQVASIHTNEFQESQAITVIETVGDPVTQIHNNEFLHTPKPRIEQFARD